MKFLTSIFNSRPPAASNRAAARQATTAPTPRPQESAPAQSSPSQAADTAPEIEPPSATAEASPANVVALPTAPPMAPVPSLPANIDLSQPVNSATVAEIENQYANLLSRQELARKLNEIRAAEIRSRSNEGLDKIQQLIAKERAEEDAAREARRQRFAKPEIPQWEKRFARGYGFVRGDDIGYMPPPVLRFVISSNPRLAQLIAEIAQKLEPFAFKFETLQSELARLNFNSVSDQFRKTRADNFKAAAEGRLDDLQPLPDVEKQNLQLDHKRTVIREAQRLTSESCKPLIVEIARHVQSAARDCAEAMDDQERATAQNFEVQFSPSTQLRAIVSGGFCFAETIEQNYAPECRSSPREFLKLLTSCLPAKPQP